MSIRSTSVVILALGVSASAFAQTAPPAAPPKPVSWQHQSEQEWIVSEIVTSVAKLAQHGRSAPIGDIRVSTLPSSNQSAARFQVDAGNRRIAIDIHDHIWAASNYLQVARLWLPKAPKAESVSPSGLLSALTTPRVQVIETSNETIGRRLAMPGFRREDYDDAALLLGAMALREGPSEFSDVRSLLSKITAYLAMADTIAPAPTKTGQVAQVVQLALVERERDVLDRLEKWEAASPSALDRTWIRALKLRVTGDWRSLDRPEQASLLERIEYVRALESRLGQNAVLDFIDRSHPEEVVDWTRIAESRHMTVEAAARFSDDAVGLELDEAGYLWSREFGRTLSKETLGELVEQLNPGADRKDADAAPIDWPTWAASIQRHLAAHCVAEVEHESEIFGRKDEARQVAARLERMFGRLVMFPLAKLRYSLNDAQHADAVKDIISLMLKRPELVTSANWMLALDFRNGRAPTGVTSQSFWFTQLVPEGTAYDAANRVYTYRRTNHSSLELVTAVRQLVPSGRYLLAEEMWWRFKGKVSLAEYRRQAGALAEYDTDVLADLAKAAAGDPDAYVPIAERLCALDVGTCATLADYLADRDRADEAALLYQKWADANRDAVGVANGLTWLITYYDTHDQHERAARLADKAAGAFSYRGLLAKARFLERGGDYAGAEGLLKQASERYDKTADLAPFYIRWAKVSGDPGVKSAGDALVGRVFPNGLEPATPADSTRPPADGVRIGVAGVRGETAGFLAGDVIVAVDGIAIHNDEQFQMARKMNASPEIVFLAWRNGRNYITIRGAIRDTWTSGTFVSYRAPVPKQH